MQGDVHVIKIGAGALEVLFVTHPLGLGLAPFSGLQFNSSACANTGTRKGFLNFDDKFTSLSLYISLA